jgi:3-hydroxymyristoyl/3-hydroxydecanoyl-(acyl carrier protein) dehydratase
MKNTIQQTDNYQEYFIFPQFTLLDKILLFKPDSYAEYLKNFTYNEWFFPPHFEEEHIVPGFILIDTLIQAAQNTILLAFGKNHDIFKKSHILMKNFRINHKLVPGDSILIRCNLERIENRYVCILDVVLNGSQVSFMEIEFKLI